MIGELSTAEMQRVLYDEVLGRIGCHARGRTYVVPVTYVFTGSSIIGHTGDGLKVRMMRENPEVCFEVEQFRDAPNWKTVIAYGSFEQLLQDDADAALERLQARTRELAQSVIGVPPEGLGLWNVGRDLARPRQSVVFAIRVHELTGRYQRVTDTAA